MIYDIFTYNGEADILEIRLNILDDFVDQFIIVEAPTTFSGKPKPLYFEQFIEGIKEGKYKVTAKILEKIKYYIVDENYSDVEVQQAWDSPNTRGANHWVTEFLQKESIKKALTHLKDNDICFIGDVDEIWNPSFKWQNFTGSPFKLKLDVYTYYLNNHSSEEFYGTLCSKYFWVRNECLNELRTNAWKTNFIAGWHFTSMGGYEEVKRKLESSYTPESYWTPETQANLKDNIENRRDFLGRNFTYALDESELPKYIKDNKERYKHLFK